MICVLCSKELVPVMVGETSFGGHRHLVVSQHLLVSWVSLLCWAVPGLLGKVVLPHLGVSIPLCQLPEE